MGWDGFPVCDSSTGDDSSLMYPFPFDAPVPKDGTVEALLNCSADVEEWMVGGVGLPIGYVAPRSRSLSHSETTSSMGIVRRVLCEDEGTATWWWWTR